MRGRPWSPEDIATLREHYGTVRVAELADQLGRTVGTLYVKAHQCGLTKTGGEARTVRPAREPDPAEPESLPEPAEPVAMARRRPPQQIVRNAAEALIRHGVDEAAAHIAAGAIARGLIPCVTMGDSQ